ncbi:MAG TPA: Franean1_4349 family RiPP [Chloroflexota bacterium]|nr:Franean1_4349 family RiPP [Chloroflexota bacterium]
MLHKNLEKLVGTAVIDGEFRAILLRSPNDAVKEFELTEEELEAVNSAGTGSIEEFAACIHAWITRAPKPRHASSGHWILDGSLAERVAV